MASLICGICNHSLGTSLVHWSSVESEVAHQSCYKKIQVSEGFLVQTIHSLFNDQSRQDMAHRLAIQAVKKALKQDSILTYLESNGQEQLTDLFNKIAVPAISNLAKL